MNDRSQRVIGWPIVWFKWCLAACVIAASAGCKSQEAPAKSASPVEVVVSGETLTVQPVSWPTVALVQGSLFPDEVTVVSARVAGRVEAVYCDLGDSVQQGDPILKLDEREFALQIAQFEAQLLQARAAVGLAPEDSAATLDPLNSPPVREARAMLDEALQNSARIESLFKQSAAVATDIEAAELSRRVADAKYSSAINSVRERIAMIQVQSAQLDQAKQQLADSLVTAPMDGRIQRRIVAAGTYVQAGQPVAEIARTESLRYRASVPERYAQRIAVGQAISLLIDGDSIEVQVSRISPTIDSSTRSLVFEAEVPNQDERFRSGLFVQGRLVIDEQATAVAIPTSAMVRFAGIDKVWRVVEGQVKESIVTIGREKLGQVEVVDGLSAGDVILLDGDVGAVGRYQAASDGRKPPTTESSDSQTSVSTTLKARGV